MFPDAENLWIQVALGEDSGLELEEIRFRGRKVSAPGRDALADELAAFANAAGGRLLPGVTGDRKPQALDPSQLDRVVNFVGEICNASIKPRLNYRVYRVPVPEGKGGARLTLPAAPLPVAEGIAARVIVTNESTGKPLSGIHVLMLYPNRTYLEAETDSFGRASFTLHSKLPMTIFCARDGFAARVTHDHLPDEPLELSMRPVQDGGSRIIANQSGHLAGHPEGIEGGLNPILDRLDRTYLYTDDIAINEGQAQPVHFALHEPLRLTNVRGACATVWFRETVGKSSVFDYERRE